MFGTTYPSFHSDCHLFLEPKIYVDVLHLSIFTSITYPVFHPVSYPSKHSSSHNSFLSIHLAICPLFLPIPLCDLSSYKTKHSLILPSIHLAIHPFFQLPIQLADHCQSNKLVVQTSHSFISPRSVQRLSHSSNLRLNYLSFQPSIHKAIHLSSQSFNKPSIHQAIHSKRSHTSIKRPFVNHKAMHPSSHPSLPSVCVAIIHLTNRSPINLIDPVVRLSSHLFI